MSLLRLLSLVTACGQVSAPRDNGMAGEDPSSLRIPRWPLPDLCHHHEYLTV